MATARRGKKPPRKRERPGEYVGFRAPPALKERLEQAARLSGRSLSSEAQFRLEQTFLRQDSAGDLLDFAFGSRLSAMLEIIGRVAADAGVHAASYETRSYEIAREWTRLPFAYDQAARAISAVIEAFRPPGEARVPSIPDDFDVRNTVENLGALIAAGALEAIRNPRRGEDIGDWATPIRRRLGDFANQIQAAGSTIVLSLARPGPDNGGALATQRTSTEKAR